jgi:hypothetical protein
MGVSMATGSGSRPAPRERFARDYAAGIAATFNPRINYYAQQEAGMRTPEAVEADITRLYEPIIGATGRVGEDVSRVGQAGLTALSGLMGSLPNVDMGMLADAARATGRAGGSAALTGAMLGSSARGALASSVLAGRRNVEEERRRLGEGRMGAEEEQARAGADWLQYASQRQQMETQALQNKTLMEDLKNAPVARRRAILENRMLRGQITAQDLQNAQVRKELKRLGFTDRQIDNIANNDNTNNDDGEEVG